MNDRLPAIECDFNAAGWSGEVDDSCYYVFDRATFDVLEKAVGMRIFVFMYENVDQSEIVGCEAVLEYEHGSWRARPNEATWYRGAALGNRLF